MTNRLTTMAVITRLEDIVPNYPVHLSFHDVTDTDAEQIIRAFPKDVKVTPGSLGTSGESIKIHVNEGLEVILFLKWQPVTHKPSPTPRSDAILGRIR